MGDRHGNGDVIDQLFQHISDACVSVCLRLCTYASVVYAPLK